jgi:hypothetical protein
MTVRDCCFADFVEVQAYVLNFNGRVEKPSVKNFQLIDDQDGMKLVFE